MKNAGVLLISSLLIVSCGSFGKKMKSFLNGGDSGPSTQAAKSAKLKFSDSPNVSPQTGDKQYRRVNREIFEKEGMLEEASGSLWTMEGQGSYLFSQNLLRVSGDVINISLDGVPRSSLEKKVEIIKTLLDRNRRQTRNVASAPPAQAAQPPPAAAPDGAAAPAAGAAAPPAPSADEKAEAEEEKKSTFDVASVPSRIVEKTLDGSYRIKGSQSFMIGRREYRVIATGVVRPADIKNDSIEASRLVDSKFDVVATRKEAK